MKGETKYLIIDSDVIEILINKVEVLQQAVNKLSEIKTEGVTTGKDEQVLFTEDVCKLFGINKDRVSAWVKSGKLKKINPEFSKRSMFDRNDVYSLLEKENKKPENVQASRRKSKVSKYGIKQLNV
jgi:hypothetical protein